jgi:recombinational DNA repair protein RecR
MTCLVCNQETEPKEAEYCLVHQRAFENLIQAFEKWDVAYENLTLPEYLQRVQKVPGIGPKAKEIARFLFENPSRCK